MTHITYYHNTCIHVASFRDEKDTYLRKLFGIILNTLMVTYNTN